MDTEAACLGHWRQREAREVLGHLQGPQAARRTGAAGTSPPGKLQRSNNLSEKGSPGARRPPGNSHKPIVTSAPIEAASTVRQGPDTELAASGQLRGGGGGGCVPDE